MRDGVVNILSVARRARGRPAQLSALELSDKEAAFAERGAAKQGAGWAE